MVNVVGAGFAGVEAAWAIVEPILDLKTPVQEYAPGTWGPLAAEKFTAGICGCVNNAEVFANTIYQ